MTDTDKAPVIVWFRDDLRLADHPALHAAAATSCPVICIYILDEESAGLRALGEASKWWLHRSLQRLAETIEAHGGRLDLFRGPVRPILSALTEATGATALMFNRRYQQAERALDAAIAEDCAARGVAVRDFVGSVLHEPWEIVPKTGGFYKVFTPYWRAAQAYGHIIPPLPQPKRLSKAPPVAIDGGPCDVASLDLLPSIAWDAGLRDTWTPGEAEAQSALTRFVKERLADYSNGRDRLGITGSSRLSPHLRFGELSPRQVFAALDRSGGHGGSTEKFKAEVGWRDFNTALLFNVPDLATRPYHKDYDQFPYLKIKKADLRAWQKGQTGYPIVDAGMRQLWTTGVMHNRVRMITASFLVKHLLADWRLGEEWFWDTLCDADPANNAVNWQWVAGCGNDPVPYFRIFNPILQGEKFDFDGAYIRRFVPELDGLPNRWIHKPWEAPHAVLDEAGVVLGKTYPHPIVDHVQARARALAALKEFRSVLA